MQAVFVDLKAEIKQAVAAALATQTKPECKPR